MFGIKANSTGKPRTKQTQLIRTAECFTCPKLQQNNILKSDHERPQPIKIKQLLDQYEDLKHSKKDSVRKKMQPERLGILSNVKKTKIKGEGNEVCISNHSGCSTKRVQRHLNFNTISIDNSQTKSENKNQLNTFTNKEPIYKGVLGTVKKRSLLIPPNTIKHKYLQKHGDKTNRCSKISKVSNQLMSGTNIHAAVQSETMKVNSALPLTLDNKYLRSININSAISSNSTKACTDLNTDESYTYLKPEFNNISYVQCLDIPEMRVKSLVALENTSPEQVRTNNETQLNVQSNALNNKNILCGINSRKISTQPKNADNGVQDLCNNLQNTKLITETDTKINHETEMIYVSKDKILHLERNLKYLLNVAEEDIQKLKLASAYITEMLSTNYDRNSIPNINVKRKHIASESGSIIMVDKAVQAEDYCKEVKYPEEQLKTPISRTSQITVTSVGMLNKKILVQTGESNKENEHVDIRMSSNIDGSFLELENQLNITHMKSVSNYPKRSKTPPIAKFKQKRSLMEYMALKSSISFLETPNGKKFKSLCEVDDTDKSVLNVRSISNKLLTDLHNLYSESPDI